MKNTNPRIRNQNIATKINTTEIFNTACTNSSWKYFQKSDEQDQTNSLSIHFIATDKVQIKYTIFTQIIIKIRMTFMNPEISKISDTYRLRLNLTDKTNLQRVDKHVVLSNFIIYDTWKNKKNIAQQDQRWMFEL